MHKHVAHASQYRRNTLALAGMTACTAAPANSVTDSPDVAPRVWPARRINRVSGCSALNVRRSSAGRRGDLAAGELARADMVRICNDASGADGVPRN